MDLRRTESEGAQYRGQAGGSAIHNGALLSTQAYKQGEVRNWRHVSEDASRDYVATQYLMRAPPMMMQLEQHSLYTNNGGGRRPTRLNRRLQIPPIRENFAKFDAKVLSRPKTPLRWVSSFSVWSVGGGSIKIINKKYAHAGLHIIFIRY